MCETRNLDLVEESAAGVDALTVDVDAESSTSEKYWSSMTRFFVEVTEMSVVGCPEESGS